MEEAVYKNQAELLFPTAWGNLPCSYGPLSGLQGWGRRSTGIREFNQSPSVQTEQVFAQHFPGLSPEDRWSLSLVPVVDPAKHDKSR